MMNRPTDGTVIAAHVGEIQACQRKPQQRMCPGVLRVVVGLCGAGIVGTGMALDLMDIGHAGFGRAQAMVVCLGMALLVTAMALPWLPEAVHRLALASVVACVCLMAIEVVFRMVGYDFARTAAAWQATPIFYRQPVEPVGDVFFRRPGPDSWSGQVLAAGSVTANVAEWAYSDEPQLTIDYSHEGFRNPPSLIDWEIVIAGDSCTELGYLPYEDLFSSRLGDYVGVRVKNLGASYTGSLSHVFYLEQYGNALSTKHAILAFFEGNDIDDIVREQSWLDSFELTGNREYRDLESQKQTSFLKSLAGAVGFGRTDSGTRKRSAQNAVYGQGDIELEVTVTYAPASGEDLPPRTRELIEIALAKWASTARALGMEPWLAYLPCKRRVLDDHLRFLPNASRDLVEWHPSDLPVYISAACDRQGIGFIDVTPALADEARRGRMTYNAIWDTHLNRHGAKLVARVLADALLSYSSGTETRVSRIIRPADVVSDR